MPDFKLERAHGGRVCGVDEVGRGPLAGPVFAAAVILGDGKKRLPRLLYKLDDSKKLLPEQRLEFALALREAAQRGLVSFAIAAASVAEIDRLNILRAAHLAMARAVARLALRPDMALVDGNLAPPLCCPVTPVIGGDGVSLSIAAASVLAKVARDRLMERLHARYRGYGWRSNKGYSTEEHIEGLVYLGPTRHHRLSFSPVRLSAYACNYLTPQENLLTYAGL
jgi:ribonuclease HII